MPDTTYKGGSPGKALVRLDSWTTIRNFNIAIGTPFHGATVLAGEGGDLAVLEALGVDLKKVAAADLDPFLVDWCKYHYPDIIPIYGDISTSSNHLEYNVAHLDFCGGLRNVDNIITAAKTVAGFTSMPATLMVTILKGREGDSRRCLMEGVPRHLSRALQKVAKKLDDKVAVHVYSRSPWDPRKMIRVMEEKLRQECIAAKIPFKHHPSFKSNGKLSSMGQANVRHDLLCYVIALLIDLWAIQGKINFRANVLGLSDCSYAHKDTHDIRFQQCGLLNYHSGTNKGGGTPFSTSISHIHTHDQWKKIAPIYRDFRFPWGQLGLEDSLKRLYPTVAELGRHYEHDQIAKVFELDPKSIPAIIAHDTRGTYNKKSLFSNKWGSPYCKDWATKLGWGKGFLNKPLLADFDFRVVRKTTYDLLR